MTDHVRGNGRTRSVVHPDEPVALHRDITVIPDIHADRDWEAVLIELSASHSEFDSESRTFVKVGVMEIAGKRTG